MKKGYDYILIYIVLALLVIGWIMVYSSSAVVAERAGHAMHAALVARIMSDPSLYEILSFDQLATRVVHALVS